MPDEDNGTRRQTLRLQKLGRFLSLLLRHRSTRFPVKLNAEGYANLKDVMLILKRLPNFRWATMADVKAVLDLPGPQRFEIIEGQGRDKCIRAFEKHTSTSPQYEPVVPPTLLYFGTAPGNLDSIKREGIHPSDRPYVQLAASHATARSIALRVIADPIILHIDAAAAHAAGQEFYNPTPGIYLSEAIPPQFIQDFQS